jgi:hypothetical protein
MCNLYNKCNTKLTITRIKYNTKSTGLTAKGICVKLTKQKGLPWRADLLL